jgi:hypothetical protein
VIFLQVHNLSLPRQLPQGAFEFPRLTGAQAKSDHEFPESKRFAGMLLKQLQDFVRGREFAHQVLNVIVPPDV